MGREIKRVSNRVGVLLPARAYCYKLFSALFAQEPGEPVLDIASSAEAIEMLGNFLDKSELRAYQTAFSFWVVGKDEKDLLVDGLSSTYTRLFIGPATIVAPLWESVYRGCDRQLMQLGTLDVRRRFLEAGLARGSRLNEADDHLSLELDFLHHLAMRSGQAWERGRGAYDDLMSKQRGFIEDHMDWVPLFATRLAEDGDAEPYDAAARTLCRFLVADVEFLDRERGDGLSA